MNLQPYLFFNGRCEEALAFYGKALGAKVTFLMRNKEAPVPPPAGKLPPGSENKVMHCEVQIGDVGFMASDGMASGETSFKGFSLSLVVPDASRVDQAIQALAEKGRIDMPPSKTFWAERFGMVTDRFGVQWMLQTPASPPTPAKH